MADGSQLLNQLNVTGVRAPARRHFLFVTAPFGPFSRRLARELARSGARASRVLLNGGDVHDWGLSDSLVYQGSAADWDAWIARRLVTESVSDLVVHGGRDPFARSAIRAARIRGVRVHVFEEGYFRPHWITLERDGANADSAMPRDPQYYLRTAPDVAETPYTAMGRITPAAVRRITAFHTWLVLATPLFSGYRPPYRYAPLTQALGHIGRYVRQGFGKRRSERAVAAVLKRPGPMFLALLQRPGDNQLSHAPGFGTVAAFIEHVVDSFADHAPAEAHLLFKCHPLDQGLEPHEQVMLESARRRGVADRVAFIDGAPLPPLIRASAGVMSVNSTGGLAAVELGRPTVVLGGAIYDMPGLTHQDGLERFWTAPQAPETELVAAYRSVVMARTQINGDFSTPEGMRLAVPEAARRMLA